MTLTCTAPTSGGCSLPAIEDTDLCQYHTLTAKQYIRRHPNTGHTSEIKAIRKRKLGTREVI